MGELDLWVSGLMAVFPGFSPEQESLVAAVFAGVEWPVDGAEVAAAA